MTAAIRPFDLPVPRGAGPATGLGLVESPSPAIGAVVCASSSFDTRGYSVLPDDGPVGIVGRVAFACFIGILGGVFAGFPVGLVLEGALPDSVRDDLGGALFLPPILLCGVIAFLIFFKRYGRGKQGGECLYAGVDGVERVSLARGGVERSSVRYLDDLVVLRGQTSTTINGIYSYDSEQVRFMDARGGHLLTLFATFHKAAPPGPDVLLTREVAALVTQRRAERARERLGRGEAVSFPIYVVDGRRAAPGPRRLELRDDAIELHDDTATPSLRQRFARGAVAVRVSQGQLEIVPASSAEAGAVFTRELVGDSDVLVALQQRG